MTRKIKEAIKATAAIILIVVAVFALWIYPLNQAGKIVVRPDQSSAPFDPAQGGMAYDTLSFLTEDNIHLAGWEFFPRNLPGDSGATSAPLRGTAILIHGLFADASSQMGKAKALAQAGFYVVIYDQRGYGQSKGSYRSGGYFEGNDLVAVIARLDLENRLVHPVVVWGEEHGGTAALRAWGQEERIDYIVAENPVVNGRDWQKRVVQHDSLSSPDFGLPIIWWWMKQKSGYEIPVEETELADPFGAAMVNKPDHFLMIACSAGDTPDNSYLADLMAMGGRWLLVPCAPDKNLFDGEQERMISALTELVK